MSATRLTRLRLADASTGRVKTPEERAKIAAALRGRKLSEETKSKIAAARRGRKRETLEEMRARKVEERRAFDERRERRLMFDLERARNLGWTEMVEDLLRSRGYRHLRTKFDTTGWISDGSPVFGDLTADIGRNNVTVR